jgi:hypothetical protein
MVAATNTMASRNGVHRDPPRRPAELSRFAAMVLHGVSEGVPVVHPSDFNGERRVFS